MTASDKTKDGGALQPSASVPTEPVADRWADLERLARAAIAVVGQPDEDDWFMPQHFANLEPEDAAFIAAVTPAAILELIAAARQQPNREG